MVRYHETKHSDKDLIPVWHDDKMPALRGFMDGIVHKVKLRGRNGQSEGAYIEKVTREAELFESACIEYLLRKLNPLAKELTAARKAAAAPLPDAGPQDTRNAPNTATARAIRSHAAQVAAAKEARDTARAKADDLNEDMLNWVEWCSNRIGQGYQQLNISLARYCKAIRFTPVQQEIPALKPHFRAEDICTRFDLHKDKKEEAA